MNAIMDKIWIFRLSIVTQKFVRVILSEAQAKSKFASATKQIKELCDAGISNEVLLCFFINKDKRNLL